MIQRTMSEKPDLSKGGGRAPCILIVDDDAMIREVVWNLLKDLGFRIFLARDGAQALEIARKEMPHLILLDPLMPGIDGLETCRRLRADQQTASIGVVLFSISGNLDAKVAGFRLGALNYITKPVEPEELVARVMVHLGQHLALERLQGRLDAYQRRFGIGVGSTITDSDNSEPAAERVRRTREILEQRIAEAPTMEGLAAEVGVSPKRLTREFRAAYGMTIFEWLREFRMMRAAELLRATSLPIGLVAECVGCASPAAFSAQFKQHFELTPRQYRAAWH